MHGALTHLCGRVPCEKCHPKEIRATNGVARIPSYGSGVGTSSLPPLQALGKLESVTMWPREGSESSYWVDESLGCSLWIGTVRDALLKRIAGLRELTSVSSNQGTPVISCISMNNRIGKQPGREGPCGRGRGMKTAACGWSSGWSILRPKCSIRTG